jgi:hemerythrin
MARRGATQALAATRIDVQDRAMLSRFEDLHRRVDAQDASRTAASLASLWFEAVGTFARQEALMELHAYPGRGVHRAAHHLFLREIKDLVRELREGGLTDEVTQRARQRVPESFALHVETYDKQLLHFMVRGISRDAASLCSPTRE